MKREEEMRGGNTKGPNYLGANAWGPGLMKGL